MAEGKALDIMQAAPIEGFATQVSGSTDLTTAGGADVVIIADRAGGGEWQGEDGLRLVGAAARDRAGAPSFCAPARHSATSSIAAFASCTSIGGGFSAPRPRRWPRARAAWSRWRSTARRATSR